MKIEEYAYEKNDIARIEKLNTLTNPKTFWDDVRKFTKKVYSDHSISRWQGLAEIRYEEIKNNYKEKHINVESFKKFVNEKFVGNFDSFFNMIAYYQDGWQEYYEEN